MGKVIISKNSKQTQKIALDFGKQILKSKPAKSAAVIALTGNLGSGKTVFTQGFAKALNIKEPVLSPTFIIERIYKLKAKPYRLFVHIDAYRLNNAKEINNLGFQKLARDPLNIILIEWADKIAKALPKKRVKISFEHINKNQRKIIFL